MNTQVKIEDTGMKSTYCGEAGDLLGPFLLKDLHQFVLVVRLIPIHKEKSHRHL